MSNFFKKYITIKINCPGGILPPGRFNEIIKVLDRMGIEFIRLGLRQCIYIDLHYTLLEEFLQAMAVIHIPVDQDESNPNIISAYPVEEIFPTTHWLSEGVYKDILDTLNYVPALKINLGDSAQTLTPLYTGNINWVASLHHPHYWHLYLRFPKTNIVIKWKHMIYTNDLMRFSKFLEDYILLHKNRFIDQFEIHVLPLQKYMNLYEWISIPNDEELPSAPFNMDYYEGLNQYGGHYWLGIYKRDEKYSVAFLRDLCTLSMETRIGQICTTPWKSIIIKGIAIKDRWRWNHLLNRYLINVRHPLNELNFQVEDNNEESLNLKKYLINHFNEDDLRTQGICFGIKSRSKSEIFCNILIKKRHLIRIGIFKTLPVYDILISKDFNPNERTGQIYAQGLFKYLLPDQLNTCLSSYYKNRTFHFLNNQLSKNKPENSVESKEIPEYIYQCNYCKTWMDDAVLPHAMENYTCSVCDAPVKEFSRTVKSEILSNK